ncbi:hypothetical protein [Haloarcula litorea]|uniref:hypothetical protein n=1 Tax=Haloarcula litorea TaxID=3032579 RepID=UPI0023E7F3FD|nr:hypothetical protein [Halomicroarcula sp. GDY20]
MGRRTLIAAARADGRFDCRVAHWGSDPGRRADARPLETGLAATAVLAELDATYDLLVVTDGRERRYCVCWLDPDLDDVDDVAFARTDDPDTLRDWWTQAKSRACDARARGVDARTVRASLLAALRRRADAVHVDDASFLRADR